MGQSWDMLEAPVGDGSAIIAFAGGDPAKGAAQPVVVVIANEFGQRLLGFLQTQRRGSLSCVS